MKNGSDPVSRSGRRFYKEVSTDAAPRGWHIRLDGRPVKTPGRADLVLPTRSLAEAVAEEWRRQENMIEPKSMPLTKLANTVIDAVAPNMSAVAEDIVAFAGRDLICYRAGRPESLAARQKVYWDPLLEWARRHYGSELIATEGVMPIDQPQDSLSALRAACVRLDPFALTAVHVMTTLTGSAVTALAHADGELTLEESWDAANLDEDFHSEQWGEDSEATMRQELRFAEMRAASEFYRLSRES